MEMEGEALDGVLEVGKEDGLKGLTLEEVEGAALEEALEWVLAAEDEE